MDKRKFQILYLKLGVRAFPSISMNALLLNIIIINYSEHTRNYNNDYIKPGM